MRAGKLRNFVTIQRLTRTRTEEGDWTETWEELASIWAQITPVNSRETDYEGKTYQDVSHEITFRYSFREITMQDRIVWGTRVFNISSIVMEEERRRAYKVLAQEVLS